MPVYIQQITINGSLEFVFDSIRDILRGMDYGEVNLSSPTLIQLEKVRTRFLTFDNSNYYHTVRVYLKKIDLDTVEADFEFKHFGISQWNAKSKATFNEILQTIIHESANRDQRRLIPKGEEIVIHREKIIERQIVKVRCRYCGTLNNDGQQNVDRVEQIYKECQKRIMCLNVVSRQYVSATWVGFFLLMALGLFGNIPLAPFFWTRKNRRKSLAD